MGLLLTLPSKGAVLLQATPCNRFFSDEIPSRVALVPPCGHEGGLRQLVLDNWIIKLLGFACKIYFQGVSIHSPIYFFFSVIACHTVEVKFIYKDLGLIKHAKYRCMQEQ